MGASRQYQPLSREETQSLQPFRAASWGRLLGNVWALAADRGSMILQDRIRAVEITDAAIQTVATMYADGQPSQVHWYARPLWGVTGWGDFHSQLQIQWRLGWSTWGGAVTYSPYWVDTLTRPDEQRLRRRWQPAVQGWAAGQDAALVTFMGARQEDDMDLTAVPAAGRGLIVQARIQGAQPGRRVYYCGVSVWSGIVEGMV
jgi:hypothetical protein